jgi:hypothetical protein
VQVADIFESDDGFSEDVNETLRAGSRTPYAKTAYGAPKFALGLAGVPEHPNSLSEHKVLHGSSIIHSFQGWRS